MRFIDDIDATMFDVPEPLSEEDFGISFIDDRFPEDRQRVERYAVRQRFRAGDEIIGAGRFDRSLVIVVRGELALVSTDRTGHEQVVEVVSAPSMVGESEFFDPAPWRSALRARTDGELLRLSFARFEALAASSPLLGRTILFDAGRAAVRRSRNQSHRNQSRPQFRSERRSRSQLAVAA